MTLYVCVCGWVGVCKKQLDQWRKTEKKNKGCYTDRLQTVQRKGALNVKFSFHLSVWHVRPFRALLPLTDSIKMSQLHVWMSTPVIFALLTGFGQLTFTYYFQVWTAWNQDMHKLTAVHVSAWLYFVQLTKCMPVLQNVPNSSSTCVIT